MEGTRDMKANGKCRGGVVGLGGLFSLLAAGCIAPKHGGEATCPPNATAPAATAASGTKMPTVVAVVPSGTVISDGNSQTIMNVDPPGSWFTFNDKSPKG